MTAESIRPAGEVLRQARGREFDCKLLKADGEAAIKRHTHTPRHVAWVTGNADDIRIRYEDELAAYTHLVFLGSPAYPAPKVADIERNTRSTYSGPLALGTDLMAFDVRNDQVIVIPDASKK